ncbi:hypothetical protein KO494_07135 [Lacinutrix sp. C3R15]|uniref:hypothetical protein n=1 Tax=Flavobacteriaceae TaxID=49546 RepID=UPI001C08E889|nr:MULTISPECIES: hypothetical protein [Flavobacteriaceae]MBU2939309.1 hypothetical protein [Lacinutrix sp. C3R15]MDO6622624.1 hypothetical protein [Oceanihabitans sp. 1_MG-2023]
MKNTYFLACILFVLISCNKEEKKGIEKELSIAEKIANAHGFKNWNKVSKIDFTFNVDKDSTLFERSWSWKPKTNDITLISNKDTINFNRKTLDSTSRKADQSFINDKFWLLTPFQLVWDSNTTITKPSQEKAPISNSLLNKITLTYSNKGGYTPGDAYDFYYDNNYFIKEWIYRKGNAKTPTLITTFENYKGFNGIFIATDHIKKGENWNLNFSKIQINSN